MSCTISRHFDELEAQLILSPVVRAFQVLRREITSVDGKIRVRAALVDRGLLEFFEYVHEDKGQVHLRKYSFHWQDSNGSLIRRWDNAPHYPQLPGAPYHLHREDGSVEPATTPTLDQVLEEISRYLAR